METIMSTALAFPLVIIGLLLAGSIYLAFCEHLKSATATSLFMFIATLVISDVTPFMGVIAVAAYFVLGVLWSYSRFNVLHITGIEKLEEIKKSFDKGEITADKAQEMSDATRESMKLTENKERIACWILGFIPSFIYYFSRDLVIHLKELIVTRLSGMYGRISKKYAEKADSFQYNQETPEVQEDEAPKADDSIMSNAIAQVAEKISSTTFFADKEKK